MSTFADRAIAYYTSLQNPNELPKGIDVLNPYPNPDVQAVVTQFYRKFFDDNRPRIYLFGINPGRFGAAITGISFTTPQNLNRYCGIAHTWPDTPEISSRFVYRAIEAFGGVEVFYQHFFLTSLYPLALVKTGENGKPLNYNFYDDRATTDALWPAIEQSVQRQLGFGCDRRIAFCLGRKNETYLQRLNDRHHFFDRILTLDHPRYIQQYRLRDADRYVEQYVSAWLDCLPGVTL